MKSNKNKKSKPGWILELIKAGKTIYVVNDKHWMSFNAHLIIGPAKKAFFGGAIEKATQITARVYAR